MAKRMAIAVNARSPPESREIFVSFLPGGQATISMPAFRGVVAVGVVELHLRLAAAEEFLEDDGEVLIDLVEAFVELLLHGVAQVA